MAGRNRIAGCLVSACLWPVAATAHDLGPLGPSLSDPPSDGWQIGENDGMVILSSDGRGAASQDLGFDAGALPANGRSSLFSFAIVSDDPAASVGLYLENGQKDEACVIEATAPGTATVSCFEGGNHTEVTRRDSAFDPQEMNELQLVETGESTLFLLNREVIAEVAGSDASGGRIGVFAGGAGAFGLGHFSIYIPETPFVEPQGTEQQEGADPLQQVLAAAPPRDGWAEYQQGGAWMTENPGRAGDDRLFWLGAGPVPAEGQVVSVQTGVFALDGEQQSIRAGAGLYWENRQTGYSCAFQLLASHDAALVCYSPHGTATEAGRLRQIAALDGTDVLQVAERGNALVALANGEQVALLEGHPSLGGEMALIAYERGRFSFAGLEIAPLESAAQAPPNRPAETRQPEVSMGDGLQGPLPQFAGDKAVIDGVYQGIATSILLHEMGHALIGELMVPSTGPEEDAVDIYSALQMVEATLYPSGDDEADRANNLGAAYAALSWYYSGQASQSAGHETPWQDEHTADLKRFRNMFCVMHGAHPALFEGLAQQIGMEDRTLSRCADEFQKQNRAWRSILSPYTRVSGDNPEGILAANAAGAPVETVFEPSSRQVGEFVRRTYGPAIAARNTRIGQTYAMPRPLRIIYRDCEQLNAWYAPSEGEITMCYEIIEHFAVMISDIEAGTTDGYQSAAAAAPPARSDAVDELVDMGVPSTMRLFPSPYRGPTPVENPKAQLVTTSDVVGIIEQGSRALLLDVRSTSDGQSLPTAVSIADLGSDGSLADGFQARVAEFLEQATEGDRSLPLVIFGDGPEDRAAYNAALRVGTAGFAALWYRGGLDAWTANGLPLAPTE